MVIVLLISCVRRVSAFQELAKWMGRSVMLEGMLDEVCRGMNSFEERIKTLEYRSIEAEY